MNAATPSIHRVIETEYKGCKFRSRLEARWAVFFDAARIPWQYEPEGFEKITGEGEGRRVCRYLPDFYLPNTETWVEVKGSDEGLLADRERITWMLADPCPMRSITDSYHTRHRGLLLLGEIPHVEWGLVAHPLIQHHEGGLIRTWAAFAEGPGMTRLFRIGHAEKSVVHALSGIPVDLAGFEAKADGWSLQPLVIRSPRAYLKVLRAYRTARAARFEHGETPRPAQLHAHGRGTLVRQAIVRLLRYPEIAAQVSAQERAGLDASEEPGAALLRELLDELRAQPAHTRAQLHERWADREGGEALQHLLEREEVVSDAPGAAAELRDALLKLAEKAAERRT